MSDRFTELGEEENVITIEQIQRTVAEALEKRLNLVHRIEHGGVVGAERFRQREMRDLPRQVQNHGRRPQIEEAREVAGTPRRIASCAECAVQRLQTAIVPAQVKYEPQYEHDHAIFRFHAGCHGLWEAERRRRRYQPNPDDFLVRIPSIPRSRLR